MSCRARSDKVGREQPFYNLQFAPTQPLLLEGDAGVSRKGPLPRQASYYYSQPHLAANGRLSVAGTEVSVSGVAWLDHEWSSEYMAPEAAGWDWTGLAEAFMRSSCAAL